MAQDWAVEAFIRRPSIKNKEPAPARQAAPSQRQIPFFGQGHRTIAPVQLPSTRGHGQAMQVIGQDRKSCVTESTKTPGGAPNARLDGLSNRGSRP
jgi:hypothetical protein